MNCLSDEQLKKLNQKEIISELIRCNRNGNLAFKNELEQIRIEEYRKKLVDALEKLERINDEEVG